MPILKKLPGRSKSCHEFPRVKGEFIMPRLDLDLRDLNDLHELKELNELKKNLNPFEDVDLDEDEKNEGDKGLFMGEVGGNLHLRSSHDGEEEENELNAEKHGAGNLKGRPLKGTLERICGVSPLKTLGKLGKGLRISGRNVWGNSFPHYHPGDSNTLPTEKERRKGLRRGSEGIMTLLRFTGRRKEERRESLPCGDLSTESYAEGSRRPSCLRISLGKLKRESMSDQASQEAEDEEVEEEPLVKTREPLSVLEILQLVNHRDLLLADTHILELERECELLSLLPATTASSPTSTLSGSTPPIGHLLSSSSFDEALSSNATLDSSKRKAKDVELLYEALQREMWDVVRESLRQPSAGPNLGLVVLVIQQEEHADAAWTMREETRTERVSPHIQNSQRPRRLKMKWRQAVAEAADWSLPHQVDTQAGQLASYLERLRSRMVDDLDAARRNAVSIYPEEFAAFQVYVESYHQAVAKRLQTITSRPLQITDVYSLLDWFYNIYNRDILGTIGTSTPILYTALEPILPQQTVDRLEEDCIHIVQDKVTTELIQVLDEEERRWAQTLHIEEYQSNLSRSVIQRLKVDLDRSTSVSQFLGARVARCCLIGLADFLFSFRRKVEMFHDTQAEFGDRGDGYVSRTIALVNCCPPLRTFVERCRQCDPQGSEESAQRANSSLDRIISQSVRVLTDRLFEHIRPFFDKLMKRKWLNNTEAFEAIEASIKHHFKKFKRMDPPPYQTLVGEVHRRVLVEYVRAIMQGRIICTSSKMRKRVAFRLQDEAKHLKGLFRDLESGASWLDSIICHLADIILLEDTPSIQMEVAVLVKEFPDIRKKHVSTVLNVRGMTRQAERQEILNVVKDFECSTALICRERALFSDIPITSEVHCISLSLLRLVMSVSNWFSEHRPRRRLRTKAMNAASQAAEVVEETNKLHREE
ncbi:exocyst complex component 3-like [Cyprinodon tularosa]|uniref:exocyst complex component 3-like n=1 Tax=Cyprinodon tularosa TaxID=77115 RepID=UPI0018E27CB8|nr:exocyst complex component 3-like [Cyprinodon tularosa]XP_038153111.1 exocyst complex component 3-like [Cyprinodon tularosa]XP_038153112.1 exocyst complex component 3-like [Cyprinodon tularosa]